MKYTLNYDKGFRPMILALREFKAAAEKEAHKTLTLCIERNKGYNYIYSLEIFADENKREENLGIAERLVKSLLWVAGGYKVYISGDDYVAEEIAGMYKKGGAREFDADFMSKVYEAPFEVLNVPADQLPKENSCSLKIGGHLDGCRIGFDAGGSDRKVSAVVDGEVVYSEEVVWFPKTNSDWKYHYDGIKAAFATAASKCPVWMRSAFRARAFTWITRSWSLRSF